MPYYKSKDRKEYQFAKQFVKDFVLPNEGESNLASVPLYRVYVSYCSDHEISPVSNRLFSAAVRGQGFSKGGRYIPGFHHTLRRMCHLSCHLDIAFRAEYLRRLDRYMSETENLEILERTEL